MFYLAGIIITFFLAIILWTKKGKTIADVVLAAWLCVIGVHLFLYYFHITNDIYKHPYLLGVQFPLPLLHGPFLYLYTVTVTHERNHFSKKYWLHFLPAAIAWTALTQYYVMPAAEKIDIYQRNGAGYEIYMKAILIASMISGFSYVLLSFYQLKLYRKRIAEEFSNTERINLNWLRYIIFAILTIWLILVLGGGDPAIFAAVVIFVSLLGYFGIKHMGIFTYRQVIVKEVGPAVKDVEEISTGNQSMATSKDTAVQTIAFNSTNAGAGEVTAADAVMIKAEPLRAKYEKSGLQKETAEKIHADLNGLMRTQKIFRQEELSLGQLAQQLGVHPNNLSQVINTYENKSFYDYINTLRIEEFKSLALLPANSRYTLLSLALECGFNSKTSFNRNFKKITGQSPSAYLKERNIHLLNEN